ncbi:MAG: hypothetical protein AAEB43_01990, partial [Acidimicrobiales bacterium]
MIRRQGQRWASSPGFGRRTGFFVGATALAMALAGGLFLLRNEPAPEILSVPATTTTTSTSTSTTTTTTTVAPTTTLSALEIQKAQEGLAALAANGFLVLSEAGAQMVSAEEVRSWLSLDGLVLQVDVSLVSAFLEQSFADVFVTGNDVWLSATEDGSLETSLSKPDQVCCHPDMAGQVAGHLLDGLSYGTVDLRQEDRHYSPEWVAQTGSTHLIGEFTTYYPAGRPRVTNIHRIAELTRYTV